MRSVLNLLVGIGLGALAPTGSAEAKPPNIVLILSDDQSYTDYSFMGHPHIETPHLDKLASESALFRRGYVPTALCRPALMTLATGLYSHQNKTTGNNPARTAANQAHAKKAGEDILELLISHIDETGALPQWLAEKGYASHQSGKWWEGSYQRGGFTEGMAKGFPNPGGRHGDAGLKIGREGMEPVFDFIDRSVADEKPFFVWYAPFLPHTPHNPPQRLLDKYLAKGVQERIAKYYAMCEWLDETCGQLIQKLDDTGVAEDTLVIYVTDNGWVQTEAGSYAERSKRSPYEGGIRNPIMFRWPGTIPAADRPELCSSLDIVPTILAAADAKGPHDFPGLNLLPELKSGNAIDRDTLFGESFAHDIADIENPAASLLYRWVIRGNDKLLLTYDGAPGKMRYPPQGGEAQLFDLKADPGEKVNLAVDNPKRVRQLTALLDEWYVPEERQAGKVAPANPSPVRKPKNKGKAGRKQAAAPGKPAAPSKPGSQPNILLLYADDQRNHTLGCAGHPIVQTPNIDRLADEGVRFENAFVSTSTCWVGRSSLFTGCYERKHRYKVTPGPLNPELCETSYFAVLQRRCDALVAEAGPPMKDIGELPKRSRKKGKDTSAPATPAKSKSPKGAPATPARAKAKTKPPASSQASEKQPDVVFIIVDDLNDYLGCLGGHPDAISPNIDSLAESGMLFSQAYCNSPQCRPSRTSLNHGVYAFNTGTYFNAGFKGETKITTPTMQQFFMENGYRVASGGKVFHGNPGKHGDALLNRPRDPKPPKGKDNFNAYAAPNDGYALDVADEEMGDYKVASWAIEQWNIGSEEPLFMSVGFFRPHRPLQVPAPWFDLFPLDSIKRPAEPSEGNDWDDMPEFARKLARSHAHKNMHDGLSDHEYIVENDQWDVTIQAYQASVAFVDTQIGRFLDSLASNPRGRETVIMLVSDHGWHLGEKKHWCKGAIWEQTLRIPFIVRAPGVEAGSVSEQPVGLIDVYPSLVDLAGLPVPEFLDGKSVRPQLEDPTAIRDPAISIYGEGNTSIRTKDWRYIRYEDGSEELYHHSNDPNEWSNVADNPEHAAIKERLARFIPEDPHPGLKVKDWFDKYQP